MKLKVILPLTLLALSLTACQSEAQPAVEASEPEEAAVVESSEATVYTVNTEESIINWEANKVVGGHTGTISVSKGELTLDENNLPAAGSFIIDMDTITSDTDAVTKHLKSEDFFEVESYPTSKFEITEVTDSKISGNLTMRDQTHNISFPYTMTKEGNSIKAQAEFAVDRTKWGITFRSGSVFQDLGDSMIDDEFTLKIDLVAEKV